MNSAGVIDTASAPSALNFCDDGGIFQDLRQGIVELGHDLGRRAGGREQAGEGLAVKFLVAEFGEGRDIRKPGGAVAAGDGERAQRAALDGRQSDRDLVQGKFDLCRRSGR